MSTGLYVIWSASKTACGPHPLPKVKEIIQEKGGVASPNRPSDYQLVTQDGELVASGDTALADPLSDAEREELAACETVIEHGQEVMEDVLEAIVAIHEHRLYREHGTWANYCQTRWGGKSRQHGHRLINFFTVAGNVSPVVTLDNEFQARSFAPLKDDPVAQQAAALIALETAKQVGMDKPTARVYQAAVELVMEHQETKHVTVDEVQVRPGEPLPATIASVVSKAAEIVLEDRQHQRDGWPWQRLTGGVFEGCLGEAGDFIQQMIPHLGGEMKVRVVVYEEKPKP